MLKPSCGSVMQLIPRPLYTKASSQPAGPDGILPLVNLFPLRSGTT